MSLTSKESGITERHIKEINSISKKYSCFIFMRLVNPNSTSLIDEGYKTKKLDIHAKSSDWGPMAGFICVDSMLSKLAGASQERLEHNKNDVKKSLNAYGVGKTQLVISKQRVEELIRNNIIMLQDPRQEFTASKPNVPAVRFKLEPQGDKYSVFYWPAGSKDQQPLFVMGYTENNITTAVTADYDLFAICPHHTSKNFTKNTVTKVSDYGMQGVLSLFQRKLISEINRRCGPSAVINHGTELNNPFPEDDPQLAMIAPFGRSRIVQTRDLHHIFADLSLKGFHVYVNQCWNAAIKAHINAKISRLGRPSMISTCKLEYFKEEDFGGLDILGYEGEYNKSFASRDFLKHIVNNSSTSIKPRWK